VCDDKVTGVNRRGLECPIPKAVADASWPWAKGAHVFDGEMVGEEYHIFDQLESGGVDLRSSGAADRHRFLISLIGEGIGETVRTVPLVTSQDSKSSLVDMLRNLRREGIVFKRLDAPYTAGRIENLKKATAVKVKFYAEASLLILGWTDKSSIRVAACNLDNGSKGHAYVGKVTVPAKYAGQINAALSAAGAPLVRVRYLYATPNLILYQPNLDPDSTGSVIRDDMTEADLIESLKLEGKEEEE